MIKKGSEVRNKKKSIRSRIIFLVSTVVAVLLLLLFLDNVYAIQVVREQAFDTNAKLLSLYMNRLDDSFEDVENYLVGLYSSNSFISTIRTDSSLEYYKAEALLKKDLDTALPSYSFTDGLFVYYSEAGIYIDSVKYDMAGTARSSIKANIRELVDQGFPEEKKGVWFGIRAEGDYYLIRFFHIGSIYVGGYVRVSKLVEKIRRDGFGDAEYLAFCQNNGKELGKELPKLEKKLQLGERRTHITALGGNTRYLVLSQPSRCGNYSLVAMIRENQVIGALKALHNLLAVLIAGILLFLTGLTFIVKRWLIQPLDRLTDAMKSLGDGNFEVRINQNVDCEEFAAVNQTFDKMTEQIRTLKIDVYEQKVRRQKAELQYLKLQVNPHFYINCLDVIHSLSIMKRNELVQQMTTYLGNHLRYTLEGNTLDYLWKEVDYVKNYLKIQQLRFGDSLNTSFQVEDQAQDILVPPLIIQTFVENAIKYQVVPGEHRQLFIEVHYENERVSIEIWDDGDGFPDWVLECLKEDRKIYDQKGEHYGIRNVRQRMELLYHGEEQISFQNHPAMKGAYVKINVPAWRKEGKDNEHFDCR